MRPLRQTVRTRPHRRFWRKWWFRRLRALAILFILGFALVVAAVFTVVVFDIPLSIPPGWIERAANGRLANLGLALDMQQITVRPRSLEVRIEATTVLRSDLPTTDTRAVVASARRLRVGLEGIPALLAGTGPPVRNVEVEDLDRIVVALDAMGKPRLVGLNLPPKISADDDDGPERFAKVSTAQSHPAIPDLSRLPVSYLAVRNFTVVVQNAVTSGPIAAAPQLVQVRELSARTDGPGQALYSGRILAVPPGVPPTFGSNQSTDLEFTARARQHFPLEVEVKWPGPYRARVGPETAFEVAGLEIRTTALEETDGAVSRGMVRLDRLVLEDGPSTFTENNISVRWGGKIQSDAIDLNHLVFDADDITLFAQGRHRPGLPPRGTVVLSRGGGPLLRYVRPLLPSHLMVDWPTDGLFARVNSDGTTGPLSRFPDFSAEVRLTSATIAATAPVRESVLLSAEIHATDRELDLRKIQVATTDGVHLDLAATIPNLLDTRPLEPAQASLDIRAPVAALLQRAAATTGPLAGIIAQNRIQSTADLNIRARATQKLLSIQPRQFSAKHYLAALPPPQASILVDAGTISLQPPILPNPIDVALVTSATQARTETARLTISTGGQTATISAQAAFQPDLLKPDPATNRVAALGPASVSLRLNQDQVRAFLPQNATAAMARFDPAFDATLTANFASLARTIRNQALPALRLAIDNARVTLPTGSPTPPATMTFAGLSLDANLQDTALTINRLILPLGPGRTLLNLRGAWNPGRISLTAGIDGNLSDIKAAIPRVFNQFDQFNGRVSATNIAIEATGLPGGPEARPLEYWQRALAQIGPGLASAWNGGRLRLSGSARVEGGTLRHISFSPAKRLPNGTAVPAAAFTNMTGTLRFDRTGNGPVVLTAGEGFRATPAGSSQSTLAGTVEIRQTDHPAIRLTLDTPGQINFDPWVFGWGTAPAAIAASRKPFVPSGKKLDVSLNINSQSSRFQGFEYGPLSGGIDYTYVQSLTAPRPLAIRNLRLNEPRRSRDDRGRIEVDATIQFRAGNVSGWPRWEADIRIPRPFSVPRIIGLAGTASEMSRSTRISGNLKLSGETFQPGAVKGRGRLTLEGLSPTEAPALAALISQTRLVGIGQTFDSPSPFVLRLGDGKAEFRDLQLTQGYVRLIGGGEYKFAIPNGPILPQGSLDSTFRIEAVGTVLRQVPFFGRIPVLGRLISQGDQIISQLVLQFRVTGDPGKPDVQAEVGSGFLSPVSTLEQAGTGVRRELQRGSEQVPSLLTRIIRWVIDRISPPIVHQWRREGMQVLPPRAGQVFQQVPGLVAPVRRGGDRPR